MKKQKLIPFSLDAWQKDPTIKLQTRSGAPATIVSTNGTDEDEPLVVLYEVNGKNFVDELSITGRYYSSSEGSSVRDIYIVIETEDYGSPETDMVAEFHKAFGHPVVEKPKVPPTSRAALRVNLIQEELGELAAAFEKSDMVEIADALCDLRYVLDGTILECGLADQFNNLFAAVHASNMSKAFDNIHEAQAFVEKIGGDTNGCPHKVIHSGGVWTVVNCYGKTIKNPNYKPANLGDILEV